jgi:hypothetical protein
VVGAAAVAVAAVGCTAPSDHRVLAVGASVVFASTDGGEHFARTAGSPVTDETGGVRAVAVGTGVDVAVGVDAGQATLWTSSDQGATWTVNPVSGAPGTFRAVRCRGTRCAAVGQTITLPIRPGPVAVSDDGGVTWRALADPAPAGFAYHTLESVDVGGDGTVVAAGFVYGPGSGGQVQRVSTLYRTHDGTNWTQFDLHPDVPTSVAVKSVSRAGGAWVAVGDTSSPTSASMPVTYRSTDDGLTWTAGGSAPVGITAWETSASDGHDVLAVSPTGAAAISTDGGATWTPTPTGLAGVTAASWQGDTLVVGGSVTGTTSAVALSSDGGATWHLAATPPDVQILESVAA